MIVTPNKYLEVHVGYNDYPAYCDKLNELLGKIDFIRNRGIKIEDLDYVQFFTEYGGSKFCFSRPMQVITQLGAVIACETSVCEQCQFPTHMKVVKGVRGIVADGVRLCETCMPSLLMSKSNARNINDLFNMIGQLQVVRKQKRERKKDNTRLLLTPETIIVEFDKWNGVESPDMLFEKINDWTKRSNKSINQRNIIDYKIRMAKIYLMSDDPERRSAAGLILDYLELKRLTVTECKSMIIAMAVASKNKTVR